MKKFVTIALTLICLLALSTSAYAYNWDVATIEECEQYTIEITKYSAVLDGDTIKYKVNDAATAKKGDYIYYSFVVADEHGNEIQLTEDQYKLDGFKWVGWADEAKGIHKAVAVKDAPCFKITITEKTAIEELFPKVQVIRTGEGFEGIIVIEDLVFTTNARGIVQEAYKPAFSTILGALTQQSLLGSTVAEDADLAKLGITRAQIKADKVLMTDDVLIANFGKVCKSEKQVCWGPSYVYDKDEVLSIPKTGDMSTLPLVALSLLGSCVCYRKRK